MHTVRNRTAMSRKGGTFRHVSSSGEKQALAGTPPAFPDQVRIPPRKGAVIRDAPLPEAQALAEAALIMPAKAVPAAKVVPARKVVPKRGQKTRRRKSAARPKRTKGKQAAAKALAMISAPVQAAILPADTASRPTSVTDLPAPAAVQPNRAIALRSGSGITAKVVRWLDALSLALVGQPLSRSLHKKRRIVLPAPRQSLARTSAAHRAPPSRQPATPGGGAGDELALLRAENARLKAELARRAT